MKKILLFLLLLPACAFGQKVNLPTQARGILPCANMPAMTGDVTTTPGTCTTVASPTFALKNGIQQQSYIYSADSGGANAYSVTLSPTPSLVAGSEVCFLAANGNSGASTLAVNGGSAKAIKKNGSSALNSGDIASGQIVCAIYDGTNFQLTSPPVSGAGTVTTSGTPANHQVALFSASTAITGAASDSTTTHALFATAGDPAFRAIQSADLPAGLNAFSALTSSTNTTASMVVGTGSSLTTSGTGVIRSPNLVVNLINAGAVCNGSNDDTVAIQAAYTALIGTGGGVVVWPSQPSQCVLSSSITLANTQSTHVIGGAVAWAGSATNVTTGTAAESGGQPGIVTLTTTSGNWPAAFAVNASIQVTGCSVTGYNGMGQIVSGGAGGTTLTFLSANTSLGAATGCSAGVMPPVFIYDEDVNALTEGFRITSTNAIGAAFSITQNSTYGAVSQANTFLNNNVQGNAHGKLNIGFEIAHGTASNPTNDEHVFINNTVYNYQTAGFVIDFFQSVDIHFEADKCYVIAGPGFACVIDTAGAGFDWHGGFINSSSFADFYGFGISAHPWTIDSLGTEQSNRLAWISQANTTQTAAACPLNLINVRFGSGGSPGLNADGHFVVYECPGPLNIHGGSYGQYGAPGDFLWAPSAGSPNMPYGSIIGVNSSGNTSQAKPLLNVSATGPPIGNAVFQANNTYTNATNGVTVPATPDISYTLNPPELVDPQTGAFSLSTYAHCETVTGVVENSTTLSTGGTTTDTGLNCLPANAVIDAVVYRITTTITTSASFTIGDATTGARFCGTQSTLTSGTKGICFAQADQTGTSGPRQVSAAKIRVTTDVNPGAGAIRLVVFYHTWGAPTE